MDESRELAVKESEQMADKEKNMVITERKRRRLLTIAITLGNLP